MPYAVKALSCFGAAFIFTFLFGSCVKKPDLSKPSPREGIVQYRFNEGTLELPAEWRDLTANDIRSRRDDGFRLEILRNNEEDFSTPSEAIDDLVSRLQIASPEPPIFGRRENLTLGDLKAASVEYHDSSGDPETFARVTVVFLEPKKSITIMASAPVSIWPKYATNVDDLIQSFQPRIR